MTYIGYSGDSPPGDAVEALRTLADLGRTLTLHSGRPRTAFRSPRRQARWLGHQTRVPT